jgi:HPt (histidine-containing phosphotransfer) domain-containing protein
MGQKLDRKGERRCIARIKDEIMSVALLSMDGYPVQSRKDWALTDVSATTQVVDPAVIASLDEAWEEGEPDLIVELIDLYLGDAPQWLEAIRTAANRQDAKLLRRAAHSLKGSSGSLGIRQVAETCRRLEQLDCSDSAARVTALLPRLDREFARAQAALAAERLRRVA